MTVGAREWYGNKRTPPPGQKKRFVRTNIRKAILVPVTSSYPHLTIDIDSVQYFRKREEVELHITKMHFSRSKKGTRIFFEEVSPGVFQATNPDAETPSLIGQANAWLRKAKFPFTLTIAPEDLPQAEAEPTSPTVEEIPPGAQAIEAPIEALNLDEKEEGGAKKKKKKKKKAPKVAVEDFFDESILEEEVKFMDLPARLGIASMRELSLHDLQRMLSFEIDMIAYVSKEKMAEHQATSNKSSQALDLELNHHFLLTRVRGQQRSDWKFVEEMYPKLLKMSVPDVSEYQFSDLLPPKLREVPEMSKHDQILFGTSLKMVSKIYGIMITQVRTNELYYNTWHLLNFLVNLASHDNRFFLQMLLVNLLGKIGVIWGEAPSENMVDIFRSQFSNPEAIDDYADEMEEFWDGTIGDICELMAQVVHLFRKFEGLTEEDHKSLDLQATKLEIPSKEKLKGMASEQGFTHLQKIQYFDPSIANMEALLDAKKQQPVASAGPTVVRTKKKKRK
ncbi:hypothetical protein FUAX_46740 (plasmid) [Fulvitalea axinellae]|uniref:Uncharacterized protein n=2 Tax=Fulvitalea axinellae TaxID=1182444 RepID=A0AAU9CZ61_9BACT|nr:hypothetical protein FUAX_46740 [Fulvitalea axinellae]